jgi:hypothetical protein
MLRCNPLDEPPPKRLASETAGATASVEATTTAIANNQFFIVIPRLNCTRTRLK